MRGPTIGVLAVLVILTTGCGQLPSGSPAPGGSPTPTTRPTSVRPTPTASPTTASPTTASPTTASPTTASSATPSCPAAVPDRLSLEGVQGRSFAFASVDDPDDVTVEGRVSGSQAWSTSKVLVAAAFLETTADGDPDAASAANRRLIAAALQSSDADAVRSLRQQIPGRPGRAMTAVLRSIGDDDDGGARLVRGPDAVVGP